MTKHFKILSVILVLACLLGGCADNEIKENIPVLTLSAEDTALLKELGTDLNVRSFNEFAGTVKSLDADDNGQVYQLVGIYQVRKSDGVDAPFLCDAPGNKATATLELRYIPEGIELVHNGQYIITGIIVQDSHGEHSHTYFDFICVETYVGE